MKLLNTKLSSLSALCLLISTGAFAWGGSVVIVYSPNAGVYSAYQGANSRADAENDALIACGNVCAGVDVNALENKQSALIETWSYNGWVALAVGSVTNSDGSVSAVAGTSGQHDNEYDAEQSALANCAKRATNCQVVRSLSSYDYQPDVEGIKK